MVSSGFMVLGAHNLTHCGYELVGKLRTSISRECFMYTMRIEYNVCEDLCYFLGTRLILAWGKVCHFSEPVNDNQYGSVTFFCLWQICDMICSDPFPRIRWDWQRHKHSSRTSL
ncbi:TPA: hypothetical protein ACH3X1_016764 [Trebouxia sp. C0004]